LVVFQLIGLSLYADEMEYYPEDGLVDKVNIIKAIDSIKTFELFHTGLYLEWKKQVKDIRSLNDDKKYVDGMRFYVFNFCKWTVKDMFMLLINHSDAMYSIAFIYVVSDDPFEWKVQVYGITR
jgi:hypothetical protein